MRYRCVQCNYLIDPPARVEMIYDQMNEEYPLHKGGCPSVGRVHRTDKIIDIPDRPIKRAS